MVFRLRNSFYITKIYCCVLLGELLLICKYNIYIIYNNMYIIYTYSIYLDFSLISLATIGEVLNTSIGDPIFET